MIPLANRHRAERDRLERVFRRYLQIAFDKPVVTSGAFSENGVNAGSVLVAVEGDRKSVQVIPDRPDHRRGLGWGEGW